VQVNMTLQGIVVVKRTNARAQDLD